MAGLPFATESIETLAHASLIIGATREDRVRFISALAVPEGDQVILDAALTGGIKDIHDFAKHVLLSPQFGLVRMGIIDNADKLTPEAQNALLKLLEEPPERIRLILFAATEATILPTIISRCRCYYRVKDTLSQPLPEPKLDLLTRFMQAEELGKQDDVLLVVENKLATTYQAWRSVHYTPSQVDDIANQLELYLQLSSPANKRLLLERFVVDSL